VGLAGLKEGAISRTEQEKNIWKLCVDKRRLLERQGRTEERLKTLAWVPTFQKGHPHYKAREARSQPG
jgi:hypothetical protein